MEDIKVVECYPSGLELLKGIETIDIDILLLDLQLPDIEAEELFKRINLSNPALPVLYLTMMRGNRIFCKLEKHIVSGYMLKDSSLEEVHNAIKIVAETGTIFSENRYKGKKTGQNTVTITVVSNYRL